MVSCRERSLYIPQDHLDRGCGVRLLRCAGESGLRQTQSGIGKAQWGRLLRELLSEFGAGGPNRGGAKFSYLAQAHPAARPQDAGAPLQVEDPPREVSAVRDAL